MTLSVSIVVVLLVAVTFAAALGKWSWRRLLISMGVLEALGLLLLGLPGGAFLETLQPLMERAGRGAITSDGAWPAAIVMSVLWPVALVPAYLAARSVTAGVLARALVMLVVLALGCGAIGWLAYGIASA